jgi:predicted negative regulator of RcsB-dependent stress response
MTLVEDLNREYSWTPYASLASLMAARFQVESNELDKAVVSLKTVMDSAPDNELRLIARTRLARVQAAQGKYDDALATLKVEQPGEFAPRLADARGDVLLAKGDRAGALREYLAARSGDADGRVDTELLDLKIRDLGGTPPPATAEAS